jgi:hypothetical protein
VRSRSRADVCVNFIISIEMVGQLDTQGQRENVESQIAQIKAYMPSVYKSIQSHAAPGALGREAFALVRRGLRGEANCFYAFEAGRVVGAPFAQAVMADVAQAMVEFGTRHCVIWPMRVDGVANGAH